MNRITLALGAAFTILVLGTGCPPPPECTTNDECGTDEVCRNETCVPATVCTATTGCTGGQVCDVAANNGLGACVNCMADGSGCTAPAVCDTAANNGLGACVGCVDSGDCSGATPVCNTGTDTCVTCMADNTGCSGATPVCDVAGNGGAGACVECLSTDNCTGGEVCDTSANACVTCLADNTGCSGGTPVCDTTANGGAGACVECEGDTDCSAGVCDTNNNVCVTCVNNNTGATPDNGCTAPNAFCDAAANGGEGACVECLNDAQCTTAGEGVCDTTAQVCVSCLSDATVSPDPGCTNATAFCDEAANSGNGQCRECVTDTDCPSATPVCNESFTCVTCTLTEGCTAPLACDVTVPGGACIGCADDSMCTSAGTPHCNTGVTPGQCVECLDNTHCSGTTPACDLTAYRCGCDTSTECAALTATPVCDPTLAGGIGACVACRTGTNEGCGAATPYCKGDQTACVECLDNTHCSATEVCNANACVAGTPSAAEASADIAAFRAAAAGTPATPLPIRGALVTYFKPAVPGQTTDPAGFFLQAEPTGPAMFVAVAPGTLVPSPVIGDRISLEVVTKAITSNMHIATAIQNFSVLSSGHPVWELAPVGLVADNSAAADLGSGAANYESELMSVTGSIPAAATWGGAGGGFQQIQITTAGVTTPSNTLRLRVPTGLVSQMGISPGCSFVVNPSVMWRFTTTAQLSVFYPEEITLSGCPAPTVVQADAMSATSVQVLFSRGLDAATVAAADFTINGLAVTGATVSATDPRRVTLTTEAQTASTRYTVTVAAGSVTDVSGTAFGAEATATFWAYAAAPAALMINELEPNDPTGDDEEYLEFYNPGDAPVHVGSLVIALTNGNDGANALPYATFRMADAVDSAGNPVDVIPAKGYLVIGNAVVFGKISDAAVVRMNWAGANTIQNGSDGVVLYDYLTGTVLDAVFYGANPNFAFTVPTATGTAAVSSVEGTPTPNDTEGPSLQRTPNGNDTNVNSADFALITPTPGAANPTPVVFNVTVPANTPVADVVTVAGNNPVVGDWTPGTVVLVKQGDGTWKFGPVYLAPATALEFKFLVKNHTAETDLWFHVEKDATCGEIANRAFTVGTTFAPQAYTVVDWRNSTEWGGTCGN